MSQRRRVPWRWVAAIAVLAIAVAGMAMAVHWRGAAPSPPVASPSPPPSGGLESPVTITVYSDFM